MSHFPSATARRSSHRRSAARSRRPPAAGGRTSAGSRRHAPSSSLDALTPKTIEAPWRGGYRFSHGPHCARTQHPGDPRHEPRRLHPGRRRRGGGSGGPGGGGGSGGQGAGGGGGGSGAGGGGKSAPDPNRYPECGTVSHPIDVVTGRVFTHGIPICTLPGPLPLVWERSYSTAMADRDAGLGYGWGHSLGWELEVRSHRVRVWTGLGTAVDLPKPAEGEEVPGKWGYRLRRDEDGWLLDVGDGVRRRFACAQDGSRRARLTAVEDRNGNRIALAYDEKDGGLVGVTDSAGRRLRLRDRIAGEQRVTTIEVQLDEGRGEWLALGTLTRDRGGDLVAATDADGHGWRHAYDEGHLLVEDTDRNGLTWRFVYDGQRRGVEAWGDYRGRVDPSLAGERPEYLYDQETRWKGIHHCKVNYWDIGFTEVVDFSQARRFHGNEHGTLDKQVIGGAVVAATYREDGWMTSRRNERGGTEVFERNERGSVVRHTGLLGHVTAIERDANDLPIELVDAAGGIHRFERDARGNVTLYVDPTGAATFRRYDARGLVVEEISPNGERTAFSYDAHGNCAEVTLASGATWRFRYDRLGRRTAEIDPFGAETRYRWSARGDLVAVIDPGGATTRYACDGEQHVTEIVDANGGVTSLLWGGYHKLCVRRDANGHEVRLGYNPEGELVEVRNEKGEVHTLRRDGTGKVLEEVTFDGPTICYNYDAAGDLIRRSLGERAQVLLEYDLAGRLIRREYSDGSAEGLEYDELGALIGATWPGGEIRLDRDAAGRVVREIQIIDGVEHRIESAYDREGERVLRETSLGHSEAVERGLFGARRRTVLDGRVVVDHASDVLGREVTRALPGGGRVESAYDLLGRLERQRAVGLSREVHVRPGEPAWVGPRRENVTVDMAYRYDPVGELGASWDQRRGWTSYQYDPVGQLLARVPEQARAEVFRYDPAGNSHEAGQDAAPREYGRGNQLVRKGNTLYRWDAEGRLAEKWVEDPGTGARQAWSYTWSIAGLLESVTTPEGERVEFRYDPFGRRVEKRVGKAPASALEAFRPRSMTRFVWDGDVLVHEIARRAQAEGDPVVEVKTYCFEDDGFAPVAHRDGGGWFHYVNDPIGTPERLVDERGEVACELRREAWGRTEAVQGEGTTTAIRFPGQYEDPETGLCYNRFRYYDSDAGRFISPDPLGLAGESKTYAYAPNTLLWLDPYGLIFARQYSLEEVRAMLAASEGRPSPLTGAPGHPGSEHVQVPPQRLRQRSCGGKTKTSFSSAATQATAVQSALNSPQGQASLAQLDSDASLVRAPPIRASLPWPVTLSQSANGSRPTRIQSSTVTVITDRLPGPGEQLHIQTAFGSP
ncbi:RHS repeat-associated core domain-containing protein [Sorangium sp. So ce726]|uniref:RHS repeat-associated core domain-containing protein n=1 Tax=Sorangium sp. So ce726 TaxID=3133319 RepID=UPI003F5D723B